MGVCSYCKKNKREHEECFGWDEAKSYCGIERQASTAPAMTSPLDEKGRADKLVQIARIIARNIDEERFYDAPAFQRAAQDVCAYLSNAPAPDELEVVAWECTDLIMGGEPGVITDVDHAAMRKLQPNAWSVEELVRRSQAHSTIAALRAERDEWELAATVANEDAGAQKQRGIELEAQLKRLTEENER